ncbi:MAG: pseudouridine synthase [Anaerolineales bacterium]|nr:pseudouridine synthase [Anaerolineales bacterium]MCX7756532.1 pseudouridine synthase [Anaerolineales bacterium]MDW8279391.1 pseudouridine synthase [Anaerolineales bacterium]
MPTLLFYKPYGVLSQFTDEGTGHPTLRDYIPIPQVYPAGRLDRDSEGLLLLTDDGALAHALTHPRRHVEKTYWVQVEGEPTEEKLQTLRRGVKIKGDYLTQPARVQVIAEPPLPPREKPVTPHGPTAWLEIGLREGKKRQIRHMTAAVGLFTLRLVRVAIGPLSLTGLAPGQWRPLRRDELANLKREIRSVGMASGGGGRARREPAGE